MIQLDYPWLLFLLPLPLVAYHWLPIYREPQRKLRVPFTLALQSRLSPPAGARATGWPLLVLTRHSLVWFLLLIAAARPVSLEPPLVHIEPQRDLVLALDLSQSMAKRDVAVDGQPDKERLAAVKAAASRFIDQRNEDRIAMVAFGDQAFTLSPPSSEHQVLQQILRATESGMAGANTALGDAIGVTLKLLDNSDRPEKLLILLTDGNDNRSKLDPIAAARIAKMRGLTVHTIGFGEADPNKDGALNTRTLADIAAITGGQFFLANDQAALARVYQDIDNQVPHNAKRLRIQPRRELFWIPVLVACAILLTQTLVTLTPRLANAFARQPAQPADRNATS